MMRAVSRSQACLFPRTMASRISEGPLDLMAIRRSSPLSLT
jgi:hypothetical protein